MRYSANFKGLVQAILDSGVPLDPSKQYDSSYRGAIQAIIDSSPGCGEVDFVFDSSMSGIIKCLSACRGSTLSLNANLEQVIQWVADHPHTSVDRRFAKFGNDQERVSEIADFAEQNGAKHLWLFTAGYCSSQSLISEAKIIFVNSPQRSIQVGLWGNFPSAVTIPDEWASDIDARHIFWNDCTSSYIANTVQMRRGQAIRMIAVGKMSSKAVQRLSRMEQRTMGVAGCEPLFPVMKILSDNQIEWGTAETVVNDCIHRLCPVRIRDDAWGNKQYCLPMSIMDDPVWKTQADRLVLLPSREVWENEIWQPQESGLD